MLLWTLGFMYLFKLVFFSRYVPGNGIAGSYSCSTFSFLEKFSYCFPQWLHQFTFPPTVYKSFFILHPHQHLLFVFFLMTAILTGVKWYFIVVLFAFPCWLVTLISFHVPVGYLHFLFGKMFIQFFSPFFNWVVWFFLIEFVYSLYMLDINPLLVL